MKSTIYILTIIFLLLFSFVNAKTSGNEELYIPKNEYERVELTKELIEKNKELVSYINVCKEIKDRIIALLSEISFKKDSAYKTIKPTLYAYNFENNNIKISSIISDLENIERKYPDDFFFSFEGENSLKDTIKLDEKRKEWIEEYRKTLEISKAKISTIENDFSYQKKKNEEYIHKLRKKESESNEIHKLAIWIGLPAFGISILALFLVPYFFKKDNKDITNQYTLDVSTVFLLTSSILILGLAQIIGNDVLGTLLGGISAYVLNRNTQRNKKNQQP